MFDFHTFKAALRRLRFPTGYLSPMVGLVTAVVLTATLTLGTAQPVMAASIHNQADLQIEVNASPNQVFAAAQEAFNSWSRGEFVAAEPDGTAVRGLSRTNLFKFVDDIDVTLAAVEGDASKTLLSIHSEGRMGERDFGGNQRNIDEYMNALEALL